MSKVLKIQPDSEAEVYFMSLMKVCKDPVKVRLGEIFGHPQYNEYEITDGDFKLIGLKVKEEQV